MCVCNEKIVRRRKHTPTSHHLCTSTFLLHEQAQLLTQERGKRDASFMPAGYPTNQKQASSNMSREALFVVLLGGCCNLYLLPSFAVAALDGACQQFAPTTATGSF